MRRACCSRMLLTKAIGEQSRESLNALNMLRALAPAAAARASTVIGRFQLAAMYSSTRRTCQGAGRGCSRTRTSLKLCGLAVRKAMSNICSNSTRAAAGTFASSRSSSLTMNSSIRRMRRSAGLSQLEGTSNSAASAHTSTPTAPKRVRSICRNSSGLCVWMSGNLCSGRRLDRLSISGDLCQDVIRVQLFLHDKPWQALAQRLQHATEEGAPVYNAALGDGESQRVEPKPV